jgi:hypothetical protein
MDVRGVRTGRAHSSGMLGGWWQGWSQARLVLLEGRSHGACSLFGDVERAHSSGMLGVLTFRLLPLTV